MQRDIMLIIINTRKNSAPTVQKILTDWGCLIKTRLGLHEGTLDNCSESGLIFLELVGEKEKHEELARKVNLLDGVQAKVIQMGHSEL